MTGRAPPVGSPAGDGDSAVLPVRIPDGEEIGAGTADGTCDTRRYHGAIIDRFTVRGTAGIARVA